MLNYPLKFTPILKQKIWGGTKLITEYHKKSKLQNIGESWEISDVDESVSIVSNGDLKGNSLRELIECYKWDLVGKNTYANFGNKFPLLIKFIDAKQDLSVQVHPNNELSKKRHHSFGKTEMWFVLQAEKDARLIVGFNKKITPKKYVQLLEGNNILSVLKNENVKKGDAFFIETGTIHAIGEGVVLAEIQQTSDITYRIYDFDRVDANGNSRELHSQLALEAINFDYKIDAKHSYSKVVNTVNKVVDCRYFKTNFIKVKGGTEFDYSQTDSFVIFICVDGFAKIFINTNSEIIKTGETVLIPATTKKVSIVSENCNLLEVTV
jgi:mannose-6-phosphate isomerase